MKQIKTLVLCSTNFAVPAIQQLIQANMLSVIAVPEQSDETLQLLQSMMKGIDIPITAIPARHYDTALLKLMKEHDINLALMLTFPYKLPAAVFNYPTLGFYNFHPGPLPKYRGPDPIFQQIKNMEPYAGLCIHKVDASFDKGPVVLKEKITVNNTDTYGTLTSRLSVIASQMMLVLLKMIHLQIPIPAKPQDEKLATYFKKQTAGDVLIDWQMMPADAIVALINACNPWNKGAVAQINHKIVRICIAEKYPFATMLDLQPGTIIKKDLHQLIVATLNTEALAIDFLHVDEGFLKAAQLLQQGVKVGTRFQPII